MEDITSREDIQLLVHSFYTRIRKDAFLGPIFNRHIHDWEYHLEHITNFWETSLFLNGTYRGNPLTVHQQVDKKEKYRINEQHFGVWLNYWIQTIDELYRGENATKLKMRARKMGTNLNLNLFLMKPKK